MNTALIVLLVAVAVVATVAATFAVLYFTSKPKGDKAQKALSDLELYWRKPGCYDVDASTLTNFSGNQFPNFNWSGVDEHNNPATAAKATDTTVQAELTAALRHRATVFRCQNWALVDPLQSDTTTTVMWEWAFGTKTWTKTTAPYNADDDTTRMTMLRKQVFDKAFA